MHTRRFNISLSHPDGPFDFEIVLEADTRAIQHGDVLITSECDYVVQRDDRTLGADYRYGLYRFDDDRFEGGYATLADVAHDIALFRFSEVRRYDRQR